MNKLKKIYYALAGMVVFAPYVALAQFEPPAGTNLPSGSILSIFTNGMKWLLILVGILGVIGFVIAGIIYLTAAGDEDQIAKGKKALIFSIVGVIVALLGLVIIRAVQALLTGSSTSF